MVWMESRAGYAGIVAAGLLAALLASFPARGDDPDRETYLREATDFTEATPWVGTGGAADIQAQRTAFHEQYVANRQAFLGGKNTLDLLLEAERFLTAADRMCCAPNEAAAATHLSVLRNEKVIVQRYESSEGQGWPVRWARTASCR